MPYASCCVRTRILKRDPQAGSEADIDHLDNQSASCEWIEFRCLISARSDDDPFVDRATKNEVGTGRVIDEEAEISRYSYDWWPVAAKWRQQGKQPYRPDVVVRPKHVGEVSRLLSWASANGVPVTPRGAGSSVTGAPLPMQGGISLDMSAMRSMLALDETNLLVRVEAGMIGHELEEELNARGYTLNHSPQSLRLSTVGGWVSTCDGPVLVSLGWDRKSDRGAHGRAPDR